MQNNSVSVRKEHFNEFVSLFGQLSSAANLLGKPSNNNFTWKEILINRIENVYNQLYSISEIPPSNKLLINVLYEVEDNLYMLSENNRRIYIKSLLSNLYSLITMQYFDSHTKFDIEINQKNESTYPLAKHTLNLLDTYCSGEIDLDEANVEQKYILFCYLTLDSFATYLDIKCLSFGLDIQAIQKEINIYLQRRRRWDILTQYGYSQSVVKSLFKLQEQDHAKSKDISVIDYFSVYKETLIPKYISPVQEAELKNLLKVYHSPLRINWLGSMDSLVSTVHELRNKGAITIPEGASVTQYILYNFNHKGKQINERTLANAVSKPENNP